MSSVPFVFTKKAFTRFDGLALGDAHGKQGGSNVMFYRPGRHPLGVSFELVSGNAPANRIPPRAAVVYHTLNPQYLVVQQVGVDNLNHGTQPF